MDVNRKQLQEALFDTYQDIPAFNALLQGMGRVWGEFAGQGTTLDQGIAEVVARAAHPNNNWLPQLLKAVAENEGKTSPKFLAFLASHPNLDPAKAPAPLDPFVSTYLLANRPFVGRLSLRQQLQRLGGANQSRILLVDGIRGSGKSYTHSFLQFMAAHRPPCRVHYFDLDQQAYSLEQFSRRLQEDLSLPLPVPPKDQEQDARWAERLADWVVRKTDGGLAGTLWLVFDGFRTQAHAPGVHDLIGKLGEMIDNTAASRSAHLRLVLINYERHVPEPVAAGAMEEHVAPPSRKEFEDSFVQLLERRGKDKEFAREAFEQTFAQAEARAKADPEGEAVVLLKYVNLAVTKALKRLTAE